MNLFILHLLQLILALATQIAADESYACYEDPFSINCTSLIQSRYSLTSEAFQIVRDRIQYLVNKHKLFTFKMAMRCYAKRRLKIPSSTTCTECLSMEQCKRHQSSDICELFCSLLPPVVPTAKEHLQTSPATTQRQLLLTTRKTQELSVILTPTPSMAKPETSSAFEINTVADTNKSLGPSPPQVHGIMSKDVASGVSTTPFFKETSAIMNIIVVTLCVSLFGVITFICVKYRPYKLKSRMR